MFDQAEGRWGRVAKHSKGRQENVDNLAKIRVEEQCTMLIIRHYDHHLKKVWTIMSHTHIYATRSHMQGAFVPQLWLRWPHCPRSTNGYGSLLNSATQLVDVATFHSEYVHAAAGSGHASSGHSWPPLSDIPPWRKWKSEEFLMKHENFTDFFPFFLFYFFFTADVPVRN